MSDARERLVAALREHALVIGEVVLTSGARLAASHGFLKVLQDKLES